jgi:carbamoyl-phosphate synthase/aspartate carbamoyltransferase/dihydroorotase
MPVLVLPGVIDAHVHLREPGARQKEDIYSGTIAALAGGVVGVLDMPNNQPPIVDQSTFEDKLRRFSEKAVCDYGLFLGFDGQHLGHFEAVSHKAAGLKLYLDETFGDLTQREPEALDRVFAQWPGPGPITVHAESHSIPVALELAERHGQRLHVAHVPHPDDLLVIEDARQRGIDVTCEVTPHHLFLDTDAVERLGPLAQMKPPLLPAELVARFWQRLDLVDMVASDHAPHTLAEKRGDNPPPGVPGLETTLPLLLWAAEQGRLDLTRMIELVYSHPLQIYGLAAPADSRVEVDVGQPYTLSLGGYMTRCGWSPFAGQQALGWVTSVYMRGEQVYQPGLILASPGDGHPLQQAEEA